MSLYPDSAPNLHSDSAHVRCPTVPSFPVPARSRSCTNRRHSSPITHLCRHAHAPHWRPYPYSHKKISSLHSPSPSPSRVPPPLFIVAQALTSRQRCSASSVPGHCPCVLHCLHVGVHPRASRLPQGGPKQSHCPLQCRWEHLPMVGLLRPLFDPTDVSSNSVGVPRRSSTPLSSPMSTSMAPHRRLLLAELHHHGAPTPVSSYSPLPPKWDLQSTQPL
jgi:hypothetical protein